MRLYEIIYPEPSLTGVSGLPFFLNYFYLDFDVRSGSIYFIQKKGFGSSKNLIKKMVRGRKGFFCYFCYFFLPKLLQASPSFNGRFFLNPSLLGDSLPPFDISTRPRRLERVTSRFISNEGLSQILVLCL